MSSDIAIKVNNLSKRYKLQHPVKDEEGNDTHELWALKDVSFEIKKGESVGIIGPNGSGKSTLLKILAGVTKPTSGKVEIRGRVASILDIGAGFHHELSGRENVFLNGQILGFRKKEVQTKFDEIIRFSGIEKFIDEPVKNYSNGMYLRLAFSIIAHLDFDVYLLDEVLSVGDEGFQNKCIERIIEITRQQKTVVIVYHNLVFSDKLVNREIDIRNVQSQYENAIDIKNEDANYFDDEIIVDDGKIKSIVMPTRKLKKGKNNIILLIRSSTGVNLAISNIIADIFDLEQQFIKINIKANLAAGIYVLNVSDISEDRFNILYTIKIEVLQNQKSFKDFGKKINSLMILDDI